MKTMIVIIAMLVSVASYGQTPTDQEVADYVFEVSVSWCVQEADRYVARIVARTLARMRKPISKRRQTYVQGLGDDDRNVARTNCMLGFRTGAKLGYKLGRIIEARQSTNPQPKGKTTWK